MQCEQCKKEITEGNFVQMPAHRQGPKGIEQVILQIVMCDECCTKVTQRVAGSVKLCGDSLPVESEK